MSEESKLGKQGTPPPLLLMGASQGLTLNPPETNNLLLPVPKSDNTTFTSDDGGEEDSFLGQTTASSGPFTFFQPPSTTTVADPFAAIGSKYPMPVPNISYASTAQASVAVAQQHPPPVAAVAPFQGSAAQMMMSPAAGLASSSSIASASQALPPPAALPSFAAGGPSSTPVNFHRIKGPMTYAQPPAGLYAPSPEPASLPTSSVSLSSSDSGQSIGKLTPTTSISFTRTGQNQLNENAPQIPSLHQQTTLDFSAPVYERNSAADVPFVPYTPVEYHWFFVRNIELRQVWIPFSVIDSRNLEKAFISGSCDDNVISTDGGRYDVDVIDRTRTAIYWDEPAVEVRRCSWFFRPDGDTRFMPYGEEVADKLEEEYKNAITTNTYHKKLELSSNETFVIHNPNVIVSFSNTSQPDQWGNSSFLNFSESHRPRVVKRGVACAYDNLDDGELTDVDHLVFVVHGIGSTCDLRFRNIIECVDDFRTVGIQITKSHFNQYHHQVDGRIRRVEFLPVRWHNALHGDATGVDRKLKTITLNSIGKLRNFTNDTLLDILFYSSPAYAQTIADTISAEMNRLHTLFMSRNPNFRGGVSVAGHSLGALILFDMLLHQKEPGSAEDFLESKSTSIDNKEQTTDEANSGSAVTETSALDGAKFEPVKTIDELLDKLDIKGFKDIFEKEHIDMDTLTMCSDADLKEMGLPMGPRKKIQGLLASYKNQKEKENNMAQIRQQKEAEEKAREEIKKKQAEQNEQLLRDTSHPLLRSVSGQSVNYLVSTTGTGIPFVKYPQLEFSPQHFFALGSPIAMFLTVRGVDSLGEDFKFPTCPSFFNIFHPFDPVAYRLEPLIVQAFPPKPVLMPHHMGRKRLHLELKESIARMGTDLKQKIIDSVKATWKSLNEFAASHRTTQTISEESEGRDLEDEVVDTVLSQFHGRSAMDEGNAAETESIASSMPDDDLLVGHINQGRRIDYVLQEKPIESFNDYLFALGSHACYWESEDTALMLLKEIYGIVPMKPGKSQQQNPMLDSYTNAQRGLGSVVPPPPSMNSALGKPPQSFTASHSTMSGGALSGGTAALLGGRPLPPQTSMSSNSSAPGNSQMLMMNPQPQLPPSSSAGYYFHSQQPAMSLAGNTLITNGQGMTHPSEGLYASPQQQQFAMPQQQGYPGVPTSGSALNTQQHVSAGSVAPPPLAGFVPSK